MQRQWMKDLRERSPRVHCITNYVTAGDVANMVLAAGGSPVMARCMPGRKIGHRGSGKKSGRPGPSRYPGPGRSHCITVSQTDSH